MKSKGIGKIIILALVLVIIGGLLWYFISIGRVSKSDEEIKVEIPLGSGTSTIADILKENKVIKSKFAFKIYVKTNRVKDFQAGTYYLKQNMNVKTIAESLKTGIVQDPNQITLTYLEGKNMRWLAKTNTNQDT